MSVEKPEPDFSPLRGRIVKTSSSGRSKPKRRATFVSHWQLVTWIVSTFLGDLIFPPVVSNIESRLSSTVDSKKRAGTSSYRGNRVCTELPIVSEFCNFLNGRVDRSDRSKKHVTKQIYIVSTLAAAINRCDIPTHFFYFNASGPLITSNVTPTSAGQQTHFSLTVIYCPLVLYLLAT